MGTGANTKPDRTSTLAKTEESIGIDSWRKAKPKRDKFDGSSPSGLPIWHFGAYFQKNKETMSAFFAGSRPGREREARAVTRRQPDCASFPESMQSERLERCLKMLLLLQSGRSYNAEQLADALDVSRRTIQRDLALLAQAGVPLVFDEILRTYKADRSFGLPPPRLTQNDLVLLVLAMERHLDAASPAARLAGEEAIAKLLAGCPEPLREAVWSDVEKALELLQYTVETY
jgi:DNA-binding transcriptional ArsR family regulator